MSEFDQLYREVILDHYKNPRHHGTIVSPDAEAEGQNPLCGDEVTVSVRFGADGETIEEMRFSGRGCAISQAATSMLTDLVQGRKASEIAELPRQELTEILKANLNAAKWFGIAIAFGMLTLIAFAVLVIGVIAIWLPLWASALIALVLFAVITALLGWGGYKRLELRGPTRSIQSLKETVRWAKARVLGRNAS